jgi:hypothetical protein
MMSAFANVPYECKTSGCSRDALRATDFQSCSEHADLDPNVMLTECLGCGESVLIVKGEPQYCNGIDANGCEA